MTRRHGDRHIAVSAMALALALVVAACSDPATTAPDEETATTVAVQTSDGPTAESSEEMVTARIGLVTLASAPTMVLTAEGFKDSISDCPAVATELVERSAEGDLEALGPLTDALLDLRVDLVATITTPAAQAAHRVVGDRGGTTPVVYATVTDPFSAGLAIDPGTHDPWITGSASPPPIAAVIDAAQEIVPDLKVLGVVRNPSEANSQFTVNAILGVARQRGLTVETIDVAETSEVEAAALELLDRSIDAFVIPTDTTVYASLPAVADVAAANDLLVIGTDPNQADSGAAIALGSDYYGSGFRAGGIACRVLGGEATPADFDVVDIESLGITINEASVEAQGVTIPQRLRDLAEYSDDE